MKLSIFLLSVFIAVPTSLFTAQKNVHKLAEEQEAARKRQKTEGAEFASTNSPMGMSHTTPINSEQTTSSSCALQSMEDIDEKLKSESQERSEAQKEFFDMFYQLSYEFTPINIPMLERVLSNPSQLDLEEIIDESNHETALLIASRSPDLESNDRFKIMQLLLNAGANANAKGQYLIQDELFDMPPLLNISRLLQTSSAPFINLLLEHGADITARNREGKSITDQIGIYVPYLTYQVVNNEAVQLLLDLLHAGAPLPQNKNKKELLFLKAIDQNDTKVITRFIQEGKIDINGLYGDERVTPLVYGATRSNIEALKTLISLGASINKQDEEGDTILHYYLPRRNPDIVKLLICAGANVNIQNSSGRTPLMEAIYSVLTNPQNFTPQTLPVIRALLRGNELYGGTDFTLHDTVSFQKPDGPEVQERSIEDYLEIYPLHDTPEVKKIKRAIIKEILRYKLEQATYKRKAEQTVRETLTQHSGKDVGPIIQEYLHGNKGFAAITRAS